MTNCLNCGAPNSDDSLRCAECGRALQTLCPQCSTKNPVSAHICGTCGSNLSRQAKDPVDEMYSRSYAAENQNSCPKPALIKIVLGAFVFIFVYLSKILSGHPILLLACGLISGGCALWGLLEITFWLLEDKGLDSLAAGTARNEQFPASYAKGLSTASESFKDAEQAVLDASAAAERIKKEEAAFEAFATADNEADSTEDLDSPDETKYETVSEFLASGIEKEMRLVKKKIARSPNNHALLIRLAQLYEERGEISLAIDSVAKCLKFKPEVAEIYLYYGALLRRDGRLKEAHRAFNDALRLNRFLAKAYYQLGIMEKAAKNLESARGLLQRCIQLSPDDPYAHYQLGSVYTELGESELAIMEMKRAVMLFPSDSYGYSKLGLLYKKTRRYDLAIMAFSQALNLKPNDSFVLECLAQVLAAQGDYKKAADIYQEAIAKQEQPEASTMIALGFVLKKLQEFDTIDALMSDVLRVQGDNKDALFLKAYALIQLKKPNEALVLLEKLAEGPNVSYEVYLELGKLYQADKKHDKAIAALVKASTNAPDQAGIWNTIGILLSNQKAYEEALKAFKKAASFDYTDTQIAENLRAVQTTLENSCMRIVKSRKKQLVKDSGDLDAYLEMGRAYELMQQFDNAQTCYQQLLTIKPDYIPGLMRFAELMQKRGKLKTAMRCYREIIKLQPENAEAHLFLVQANLNLGFLNEALRHAVTAQKIISTDPRVHFLLGKIYFAKGLAPRALKEFTTVAASANAEPDIISWAELMRRRLSIPTISQSSYTAAFEYAQMPYPPAI